MQKHTRFFLSMAIMIVVFTLSVLSSVAQSNTPENLRIAFVSNRDGNENIYLMQPDGTNQVPITTDAARDWNPAWSPDGGTIIFNSNRDGRDTLYLMNFDGNNVRALFPGETFNDYSAAWSPDGSRIVFTSDRAFGRELFVVNADGSNLRQLTVDKKLTGDPIWSPDSTEVAYWQLENEGDILMFRRQVDGEGIQLITTVGPANGSPIWFGNTIYFDTNRDGLWYIYSMESDGDFARQISEKGFNSGRVTISPDGGKLAFVTDRDDQDSDEIYTMNVDGAFTERLTENGFSDHSPAWQPAVPKEQAPPPTPIAAEEPVEVAATGDSVDTGAAVGLSVSGVQTIPISKQQLLIDYGIREWHVAGWTGAGQKIGVIDTAFGNLDKFLNEFAYVMLPPGVPVSDYSIDNNDHGRDVLEVIHTVAPGASLYACRYQGTLEKLRECVDFMKDQGVQIINHSVGIPVADPDGQSEWAKFVDEVSAENILWVNSAGNFNHGYVVEKFDSGDDQYHDWLLSDGSAEPLIIRASEEESYSGTILLSWNASQLITNPATGLQESIDLDVEVVSRVRPSNPDVPNDPGTFGVGNRRQSIDPTLPQFEIVYLKDVKEPFEIRVKNAGSPFPDRIEFQVFVEYASVPDTLLNPNGSVVAPADASSALSVGSVNGLREVASYSSHGAVGTTDLKPDIAAPGEIYMDDGSTFIGTSAAAPVVSGIAALLLEGTEGLRVELLPRQLTQVWLVPIDDSAMGAGIVQLSAPRARQSDEGRIDTPPFTIFPREDEPTFVNLGFSCPLAMPTRFELDMPGYVNYNLGLAIRATPGEEGKELVRLDFGTDFTVIGGPECTGSSIWWLIELANGAEGWVSEGIGYYLITPVNLESARLPNTYDTVCSNALDPELSVGERGRLVFGGRFFFRGERANTQMDPLDSGTIVEVLGGPVCEGRSTNELRWYVRVISGDGDQIGYEGWLDEGGTESRNIIPITD